MPAPRRYGPGCRAEVSEDALQRLLAELQRRGGRLRYGAPGAERPVKVQPRGGAAQEESEQEELGRRRSRKSRPGPISVFKQNTENLVF